MKTETVIGGAEIPRVTMREFFSREDVKRAQAIQKANPYGSKAHRWAYYEICQIALTLGVGHLVKREDY